MTFMNLGQVVATKSLFFFKSQGSLNYSFGAGGSNKANHMVLLGGVPLNSAFMFELIISL